MSIGFCPSQHNSSTSLWSKWKDSASVLLVDILHNRILLFHLIQFESNLLSPPHSWFQSIPPQSASSYSCMLPPSPSAPRSFDSSAYSSPHLQTPSSANSNTGTPTFSVCLVSDYLLEWWIIESLPAEQSVCVCLPRRPHIAGRFRPGPGPRIWAAGHGS